MMSDNGMYNYKCAYCEKWLDSDAYMLECEAKHLCRKCKIHVDLGNTCPICKEQMQNQHLAKDVAICKTMAAQQARCQICHQDVIMIEMRAHQKDHNKKGQKVTVVKMEQVAEQVMEMKRVEKQEKEEPENCVEVPETEIYCPFRKYGCLHACEGGQMMIHLEGCILKKQDDMIQLVQQIEELQRLELHGSLQNSSRHKS